MSVSRRRPLPDNGGICREQVKPHNKMTMGGVRDALSEGTRRGEE